MSSTSDIKEWIPRIGYIVRGIVYFIIGILAVMVAVGAGGQLAGSRGALESVQNAPFADVLLGVMGIGLLAFAVWRFVECFLDAEHKGTGKKAIVKRTGYFVSGVLHTLTGVYALLLIGAGSGGGGGGGGWSQRLMSTESGPWIVGFVGLCVAGVAIYQFMKAKNKSFMKYLRTEQMSRKGRRWAMRIGQIGFAARGVVFGIVAWFLLRAAAGAGSVESAGFGEALSALASQPYGTLLLFIVAMGLAAFGVHSAVMGYYRRIAW